MSALVRLRWRRLFAFCFLLFTLVFGIAPGTSRAEDTLPPGSGLSYTNARIPQVPWSIHVVKIDRTDPSVEIDSMHAKRGALGLGTLTDQIRLFPRTNGVPVAAVNGDFYKRDQAYAGDPRGLQIVNGELISAPVGGVSFWVDAANQPHIGNVISEFEITWPDGQTTPFGLNAERRGNELMLYTPAAGPTTKTSGGRELVLENPTVKDWLPLKIDRSYAAVISDVNENGNTRIPAGKLVLSIPPGLGGRFEVKKGAILRISTGSAPSLRGAKSAISGGPMLVHEGKQQRIRRGSSEGYESSSMLERHPRTALGWNEKAFFLVEVDGRQRQLSVGMTLEELGAYLAKLGCTEAMNLDGGGSAMLWFQGRIRNSPCDGREREIANSLVVIKRSAPQAAELSAKTAQ